MRKKFHIRKGDTVMVIAGDSKGQQGRVLMINLDKNSAIVEGVNMMSKHSRPNTQNPKGGIIHKEAPIHVSNLKVIDASGKPTRVGRRIDAKTDKSIRFSIKSGEAIK